jgi:hypothetical protein
LQVEDIFEFFRLKGFFTGNLVAYSIERTIEMMEKEYLTLGDSAVVSSREWLNEYKSQMQAIANQYQMGDAPMKIGKYLAVFERYADYYQRKGDENWYEKADEVATRFVYEQTPNYHRAPKLIKALSYSPTVGMFILFRAELIRNYYNINRMALQELTSGDVRLMAHGAGALAMNNFNFFRAQIIVSGLSWLFGFDDDDEEAIRMGTNKFTREGIIVPVYKNGTEIKFINLTYMDMHSEWAQATREMQKGNYAKAGSYFTEGVLSPDVSTKRILDAGRAYAAIITRGESPRDDFGNFIFNPSQSVLDKTASTTAFMLDVYLPGFAKDILSIIQIAGVEWEARNMTPEQRAQYEADLLRDNIYRKKLIDLASNAAIGLRLQTYDVKNGYRSNIIETKRDIEHLKSAYGDVTRLDVRNYFSKMDEKAVTLNKVLKGYTDFLGVKEPSKQNLTLDQQASELATFKKENRVSALSKADLLFYQGQPTVQFYIENAKDVIPFLERAHPDKLEQTIKELEKRGVKREEVEQYLPE